MLIGVETVHDFFSHVMNTVQMYQNYALIRIQQLDNNTQFTTGTELWQPMIQRSVFKDRSIPRVQIRSLSYDCFLQIAT